GRAAALDRCFQFGGFYQAIREAIQRGGDAAPALFHLRRTFEALRLEGENGVRVVVEGIERELQPLNIEPTRRFKAEHGALFQTAIVRFEGDGVVASVEVDAAYIERDARTYPNRVAGRGLSFAGPDGRTVGRARTAGDSQAGLGFETEPIIKGVALGLVELHQEVFVGGAAAGVLHRHIDFVKQAEVIETALRLQLRSLAERVATPQAKIALHYKRLGVTKTGDEYAIHKYSFAFRDAISNVHARHVSRRRRHLGFHLNVGIATVEIKVGDG